MDVPKAVLAGMRKTNDLFCSTVVRGRDMNALEQVYTPDAHILPPGAELIAGVAAIKAFWLQAITGLDVKDASLSTVSAETAGEDVIEIGRAALTLAGGQVCSGEVCCSLETSRRKLEVAHGYMEHEPVVAVWLRGSQVSKSETPRHAGTGLGTLHVFPVTLVRKEDLCTS